MIICSLMYSILYRSNLTNDDKNNNYSFDCPLYTIVRNNLLLPGRLNSTKLETLSAGLGEQVCNLYAANVGATYNNTHNTSSLTSRVKEVCEVVRLSLNDPA